MKFTMSSQSGFRATQLQPLIPMFSLYSNVNFFFFWVNFSNFISSCIAPCYTSPIENHFHRELMCCITVCLLKCVPAKASPWWQPSGLPSSHHKLSHLDKPWTVKVIFHSWERPNFSVVLSQLKRKGLPGSSWGGGLDITPRKKAHFIIWALHLSGKSLEVPYRKQKEMLRMHSYKRLQH